MVQFSEFEHRCKVFSNVSKSPSLDVKGYITDLEHAAGQQCSILGSDCISVFLICACTQFLAHACVVVCFVIVLQPQAEYMVNEIGALTGCWQEESDYVTVPDGASSCQGNVNNIAFGITCSTAGTTTISAEIIAPDTEADSFWVKVDNSDSSTTWHTGLRCRRERRLSIGYRVGDIDAFVEDPCAGVITALLKLCTLFLNLSDSASTWLQ